MKSKNRLALSLIKRFFPFLILAFLSDAGSGFISLYLRKIFGDAMDLLIAQNISEIYSVLPILITLAGFNLILIPALSFIVNKVLLNVGVSYDLDTFSRLLNQKKLFLDKFDKGDLLYRIGNDPIKFRLAIIDLIVSTSVFIFIILQALYMMIILNFWFAIICLILSAIPVIIPVLASKKYKDIIKKHRKVNGELIHFKKQVIKGIEFIKAQYLYKHIFKKINQIYENIYEKVAKKRCILENIIQSGEELASVSIRIIIFIIGSYLVSIDSLTTGNVIQFFGITTILQDRIKSFIVMIKRCYDVNVSIERLYELIGNEEKFAEQTVSDIKKIKIKNVNFSYNDKQVLKNISLEIDKGEVIVITGKNGSGKSTFLNILGGLYTSYKGNIYINGKELKKLDLKKWRMNITYIPQKKSLFNSTVYENVSLSKSDADQKQIYNALDYMNLGRIGNKNVLGGGENISGGQKQRIYLARAILRDSPLILLDEPTLSLDNKGVKSLFKFVESSSNTFVIISHNNRIIKNADKVHKI